MGFGKERLHENIGPLLPIIGVFDLLCVILSSQFSFHVLGIVRPQYALTFGIPHYQQVIFVSAMLLPLSMTWFGGYKAWRGYSLFTEVRIIIAAWISVIFILALLAFLFKSGPYYSRLWLIIWFLTTFALLTTCRAGLRLLLRALRKNGFDLKNIIIVGEGEMITLVSQAIQGHPSSGLNICGYFADSECRNSKLKYIGVLGEVSQYIQNASKKVDQLWIAMPMSEQGKLSHVLADMKHSTVDIRMVPDMFSYQLLNYSVEEVVGLPVLNISFSPFSGSQKFIKEFSDYVLASSIALVIFPFLILIAFAVKLSSSGPVIFKQVRHGWDGQPFTVYKFRTMEMTPIDTGSDDYRQATKNDSRITRLGYFLRKTSLDELPQFFNVLKGDMSIVGPRPHPVEMNKFYMNSIDRYMLRHKVKPGITGWAQINGHRGETDTKEKMEARIKHDLYYIENWSLSFDLKIIGLTILRGFWHPNAY